MPLDLATDPLGSPFSCLREQGNDLVEFLMGSVGTPLRNVTPSLRAVSCSGTHSNTASKKRKERYRTLQNTTLIRVLVL